MLGQKLGYSQSHAGKVGIGATIDHSARNGNIVKSDTTTPSEDEVKRKRGSNRGPHIYWRTRRGGVARAYGDFRGIPGGTREPLKAAGSAIGTADLIQAQEIFARRLRELTEFAGTREASPTGARRMTLGGAVASYLEHRRRQGRATASWIESVELMLGRAVRFFGATRALGSIRADDVAGWLVDLRSPGEGRMRQFREETVRKHMNALAGLFSRAQRAGWVPQGCNPVSLLEKDERPTREPSPTEWLEVHDAARLLEAARTYRPSTTEPEMRLAHPMLAAFLLTGGRADEVLGLDIADLDFERKLIHFRPNQWRSGQKGKTTGATRSVPMWPQLEAVLRDYLVCAHLELRLQHDPGLTLLFPSPSTGGRIRDIRGIVDRVARRAGLREGVYRSRSFRITYATARLQTTDRGAPIAQKTVEVELGHASGAMLQRVYGRLGTVRERGEVVEYRARILESSPSAFPPPLMGDRAPHDTLIFEPHGEDVSGLR
jgi:integrase